MGGVAELKSSITNYTHVAVIFARNLGERFPPNTELLEENGLQ